MPETPILELENVVKQYDAPGGPVRPPVLGGGAATAILRGITLSVAAGDALAIVGPSGSGKSTLLNIMGTLDRPTSGRVRLEGRDLANLDDEALAAIRNRRIGFVFQLHHLLPQCTALENVLVPTLAPGARQAGVARPVRAVARGAQTRPRPDEPAVPHGAQWEPAEDRARRLLERVASLSGSIIAPGNFRAASASAWRWPGRSSTDRPCCWPMSPRGRSTAHRQRTWPSCSRTSTAMKA